MAARDPFALKDLKEYEGVHCYHHLIDISQSNRDKVKMEENLVRQVNDAIHMIEEKSGREIELMYIGKTYADKKEQEQRFNRLDPTEWDTKGIKARWDDHRSENPEKKAKRNADHAKDGMVVVCVFTRDDLPAGSRRSQEYLALAMEQRLIHHFQIFDARKILINKTFDEGSISTHTKSFSELSISVYSDNPELDLTRSIPKPNHYAGVLYMTFAFLPPEKDWKEVREKQKTALKEQREKETHKKEREEKRKEQEERERIKQERDKKQTRKNAMKSEICLQESQILSKPQSDPHQEFITPNLVIEDEDILGEGPPQDDSQPPDDSLLDDTSLRGGNPPLSHAPQGATQSVSSKICDSKSRSSKVIRDRTPDGTSEPKKPREKSPTDAESLQELTKSINTQM